MKANKFLSGLALVGMMVFISCGDDESGPGALTVESVTASGTNFETGAAETGIDLFGATSVVDAPLDLTVEVTFNKEVDASTVDASSITIGGLDGDNTVTVTTNGAVVTIATSEELVRGTDYTIEVAGSVTAVDGGALAGNVSTSFSTAGVAPVTPPQEASQQIYYDFNNNLEDEVGSYNPDFSTAITYGEDRFGQASSAAVFDGDVSIVEIPDADPLMETSDFTMSFWVRTNSEGHVDAGGNPAGILFLALVFSMGFNSRSRVLMNGLRCH
ncbi:MAG: Ig-like domain-containing protein [Bacteroidota bacterium]